MAHADLLDTPDAGPAAIRGGALRVAGYLAGVVLSVGSAMVLLRHLGVAAAGDYVLVLSIVTLSAGVTDLGLSSIGVREVAVRTGPDREALLRNLMGLRIAFSLTGIAAACGYAALVDGSTTFVLGTAIAGFGILAINIQNTAATVLMAELRLGWVTAIELLRQALNTAIVLALALAGAALLPFFGAGPAAGAVAFVVTVVLVRGTVPLRPQLDWARWRRLLAETLPFALAVAVSAVYFRLGILFVDLFSNDRQTGLFGASFRVIEVLMTVPQLVVSAALPIFARAARDDAARLRYALQKMLDTCLLLGAAVAIVLGVGAPVAIEIVGGPQYRDAADVLRLHALALGVTFAAQVFGYALLSLRRYRALVTMSALALLASALTMALLVPAEGATGGALGAVAGELTLTVAGLVLLARGERGVRLRMASLPRVLLALAGAATPALVLPALPAVVLALPLLCLGLLALRVVPEELLAEVRRVRAAAGRRRRPRDARRPPR